jgi:hypothetical protein
VAAVLGLLEPLPLPDVPEPAEGVAELPAPEVLGVVSPALDEARLSVR